MLWRKEEEWGVNRNLPERAWAETERESAARLLWQDQSYPRKDRMKKAVKREYVNVGPSFLGPPLLVVWSLKAAMAVGKKRRKPRKNEALRMEDVA
jgi:hypothetical protein